MRLPPLEIFTAIRLRHGHYCPMSTLGGRMGWAARQRLAAGCADSDLRATVYARTCALDGISRTTGCSESAGTLTLQVTGEQRLDLCRLDGSGIVVTVAETALRTAWRYRQAASALERERAVLAASECRRRETELAQLLDETLVQFRTQPDEEVLNFAVLPAAVKGQTGCR